MSVSLTDNRCNKYLISNNLSGFSIIQLLNVGRVDNSAAINALSPRASSCPQTLFSQLFTLLYFSDWEGWPGNCILRNRRIGRRQPYMKEKIVLLLVVIILVPISARADLITNGSFEDPGIVSGKWHTTRPGDIVIPGWTLTAGDSIELRNNVAGTAYDGSNFVELDSYANSAMSQTVDTDLNSQYTLSYWYAPRENVAEGSNGIELLFNDMSLGSITGSGSVIWSLQTFTVIGTGFDTITFRAVGTSDSYGGSIDMVSMELANEGPTAVPEPTSLLLLGTGLGAIGLAAWRRRK
jgi:hypothetical protein